jgi:hypothetical protein
MGETSEKNYRVITSVRVGPIVSQEHVLACNRETPFGEIIDWLNHLSETAGITGKITIGKAVNGFATPGLVPEED